MQDAGVDRGEEMIKVSCPVHGEIGKTTNLGCMELNLIRFSIDNRTEFFCFHCLMDKIGQLLPALIIEEVMEATKE